MNRILGANQQKNDPVILRQFTNYHPSMREKQHTHNHSYFSNFIQIWTDPHIQVNKLLKCAIKGAVLGLGFSLLTLTNRYNVRKIQHVRRLYNAKSWTKKSLFHYSSRGAVTGIFWYFWYYKIFCDHENKNFKNHHLAYASFFSLLGGLMVSTSAFYPGALLGLFFAMTSYQIDFPMSPSGLQYQIPTLSAEARQKQEFQDALIQLGKSPLLKNSFYTLPELNQI